MPETTETQVKKPAWMSKGVWGPVLTMGAIILAFFGITVDAEDVTHITEQLDTLITAGVALAGSVIGLIGRIQAKGPVTLGGGE